MDAYSPYLLYMYFVKGTLCDVKSISHYATLLPPEVKKIMLTPPSICHSTSRFGFPTRVTYHTRYLFNDFRNLSNLTAIFVFTK